jgi:hypothetical protein
MSTSGPDKIKKLVGQKAKEKNGKESEKIVETTGSDS